LVVEAGVRLQSGDAIADLEQAAREHADDHAEHA